MLWLCMIFKVCKMLHKELFVIQKYVITTFILLYFFKVPCVASMNLLYQDGANTTITVLRVPAGVSEYGWMLEKKPLCLHVNPRKPQESTFLTGF